MSSPRVNRWWTVASGFLGTGFGIGIFIVYVLGGLTKPMAADLGFDRSVIAFSMTCFLIATGAGAVSLGLLIHRFGICRPAFAYVAVTALLVALAPSLPPTPIAFYLLFCLLGVSGAASTAFPYSVAITGLFDRNRGLALALAVTGGGAGGALAPLLGQFLETHFGWRTTFQVMAVLIALPAVTLALFVRTPPGAVARAGAYSISLPFLRSSAFWKIAAPMLAIAAAGFVLATLIPLLTDGGLSRQDAAQVLSVAAFTSLLSRLGVGWLLDRIWGPLMTAIVCIAGCLGLIILAICGQNLPLAYLGAALIALGLGAEADLLTYLSGRYFTAAEFSRVVGTLWVVWAWGGSIGTAAAGVAFKTTGSYQPALWGLAVLMVVAALCVLRLGPYRYPPGHSEPLDPELEPA